MSLYELIASILQADEDGQRALRDAIVMYWGVFGDASELAGLDKILNQGDHETVELVIDDCIVCRDDAHYSIVKDYPELTGKAASLLTSALETRRASDPVNKIIATGLKDLVEMVEGESLEMKRETLEEIRDRIKVLITSDRFPDEIEELLSGMLALINEALEGTGGEGVTL